MRILNAFQHSILPLAEMTAVHQPVLYHEIIHALDPRNGGLYLDCTVGAGGHARGVLEACAPNGRLIGLDVDPQAIEVARKCLAPYGQRVLLIQASYIHLEEILQENNCSAVDGIVLDLGASSMQFSTPARGFSFKVDGPLDMRFDPTLPTTASDLVNELSQNQLADLIFRYGEERNSRRIARAIVESRPLYTTKQLSDVIETVSARRRSMHPATLTFQALRIVVNDELTSIQKVLPQALNALKSGARFAVIAFHSLEDRIVKKYFIRESQDCLCPSRQPICTCEHSASVRMITRHPITPGESEIKMNPRSRSAKLRIVEKI